MAFNIRCQRKDLLNAVQAADAVAPHNSTKPILSNLHLTAGDEGLEIVATDLQIGLRAVILRQELIDPGSLIISSHQLFNILKESSSDTVNLRLADDGDNQQIVIDLDDGAYMLPMMIGEVFPEVTTFPSDGQRVTVNADRLTTAIRKTSFGIDKERSSAVLAGEMFRIEGDQLVVCATDGKVLGEFTDGSVKASGKFDIIMPAQTIAQLERLLGSGATGEVELASARELLFVRMAVQDAGGGAIKVELTGRLIEGSFPPYRSALEKEPQQRVTFDVAQLQSAVRRSALMTSSASRGIVADIGTTSARFSNLNHTAGCANIEIPVENDGEPIRLGLNANYVSSVLRAYEQEKVTIELNGHNRGMVMRDTDTVYLVMPISLPS